MDLFEIWDEVVQILKTEQIAEVIRGNDKEGLKGEITKVAQVLSSSDVTKEFVELKIHQ